MWNIEIRQAIKVSRFMQYEIAAQMGISEYTLCRWLRREMTTEQKESVYRAIAELKAGEASV